MKAFRFTALIVTAFLLVFASACSGSKDQKNDATGTPPAQSSDSGKETTSPSGSEDGPFTKYDPPIKLTTVNAYLATNDVLPEGQTPEKNVWSDAFAQELGVNVNVLWTVPSTESAEKMNLAASSNDLPDVFGALPALYVDLVKAGKVEDLTEAYERYASPEMKALFESDEGRALDTVKFDGKMYGLPVAVDPRESVHMLWIRKDWLDKLQLPLPQTMADVFAISDAFTNRNPNDTPEQDTFGIGLTENLFSWDTSLVGYFNAYHAYPMDANRSFFWIKGSDGKLMPGVKQEEMRPALLKLQEMYKSGQIDKEFVAKDGNNLTEQIAQNKIGMFFGGVWDAPVHIQSLINLNPDAEWIVMKIPSIDNEPATPILPGAVLQRIFVMKKGYQNPEAIIKMGNLAVKLFASDPETYHSTPKDERIWRLAMVAPEIKVLYDPKTGDVTKAVDSKDPSQLSASSKTVYDMINSYLDGTEINNWGIYKTYYGEDSAIGTILDYEKKGLLKYNEFYGIPTEAMNEYFPNLSTKFLETVTKIIMGADISQYDEFLNYWDKQGGKIIEDEVNAWYSDRK